MDIKDLDAKKLHGEVTQIVQQRFYLSTIAVVLFGTVCGWLTSATVKGEASWQQQIRLLCAGSSILILVIAGLFTYFRMLLSMMRIFTSYVIEKFDSEWEKDWNKFQNDQKTKHYWGYSRSGKLIFRLLIALSFVYPTILGYFSKPVEEPICSLIWFLVPFILVLLMFFVFSRMEKRLKDKDDRRREDWQRLLSKTTN
jgi:hypothetical protein